MSQSLLGTRWLEYNDHYRLDTSGSYYCLHCYDTMGRQCFPPKRRYSPTDLRCVITQNTKIRILTNLKTLKPRPFHNRPRLHNADEKRTWVLRNSRHTQLSESRTQKFKVTNVNSRQHTILDQFHPPLRHTTYFTPLNVILPSPSGSCKYAFSKRILYALPPLAYFVFHF
jgi:hypothetical protein